MQCLFGGDYALVEKKYISCNKCVAWKNPIHFCSTRLGRIHPCIANYASKSVLSVFGSQYLTLFYPCKSTLQTEGLELKLTYQSILSPVESSEKCCQTIPRFSIFYGKISKINAGASSFSTEYKCNQQLDVDHHRKVSFISTGMISNRIWTKDKSAAALRYFTSTSTVGQKWLKNEIAENLKKIRKKRSSHKITILYAVYRKIGFRKISRSTYSVTRFLFCAFSYVILRLRPK